MFRKRTPGQAPTGPSWLIGDEMPAAQSQRAERLRKSSEINGAWQIGASGSEKNGRQGGGLSQLIINNGAPGQSQAKPKREERLRKSSEINNAWQIEASGSDEKERQDGGLSEVILNNDAPPGQSQRKESRKRRSQRKESRKRRRKRIVHEDCVSCGDHLNHYDFYEGNPSALQCGNCYRNDMSEDEDE